MVLALLGCAGLLGGCGVLGVKTPTLMGCGEMNHGDVPHSAAAASRMARKHLADIVGEPSVLRQEPFTVTFDDYRWVVRGTLPPGETHGRFLVVLDGRTGCVSYAGADDMARP
jgi:NTF2 fold immunity protein